MSEPTTALEGVEALVFDAFGTVTNWEESISREVQTRAPEGTSYDECVTFTREWRAGYLRDTKKISEGGEGPLNADVLHRGLLEDLLDSPRWSKFAAQWSVQDREDLNLGWHRLNAWPDASEGLHALKKHKIVAVLSNGNVRLLVDMAKHADFPWDVVFSGEMFGSYKTNPKLYHGAAKYLSLPPSKCAMVAAHSFDLRAAASCGYKTVYVRRETEDNAEFRNNVKSKKEGGEVDAVVDSLLELVSIVEGKK